MLLITEYNDTIEAGTEINEATGKKDLYISGIFMQAEAKNRNGRVYPRKVLTEAVDKYIAEQVVKKRSLGELDHPASPSINLDRVSHMITDLKWEGNDVIGKAKILETPMGAIVKGIISGGGQLGVSSRGTGSLATRGGANIVESYNLNTVDVVQDPSAMNAMVNGILEGVEWEVKNGIYTAVETNDESIDETIKTFDSKEQINTFKKFLDSL